MICPVSGLYLGRELSATNKPPSWPVCLMFVPGLPKSKGIRPTGGSNHGCSKYTSIGSGANGGPSVQHNGLRLGDLAWSRPFCEMLRAVIGLVKVMIGHCLPPTSVSLDTHYLALIPREICIWPFKTPSVFNTSHYSDCGPIFSPRCDRSGQDDFLIAR